MKLEGCYRLLIEGDTSALVSAGGRNPDVIGYLMQRLLTGQEAAMEELSTWGITVAECDPGDDQFVKIERME